MFSFVSRNSLLLAIEQWAIPIIVDHQLCIMKLRINLFRLKVWQENNKQKDAYDNRKDMCQAKA